MLFLVILGERLKGKIRKWPNGEEKALLTFGTIVLCCEGRLVHYRMFSSIPGLYPLDGDSAPPSPQLQQSSTSRSGTAPLWDMIAPLKHC